MPGGCDIAAGRCGEMTTQKIWILSECEGDEFITHRGVRCRLTEKLT